MYGAKTIDKLLSLAEKGIKDAFSVEKALLYVVDGEKKEFYRYDAHGDKTAFPLHTGIVGQSIVIRDLIEVKFPNNDPNFNARVDIDTHIPLVCIPIFEDKTEEKVVAVMEMLNIGGVGNKMKNKGESLEVENLQRLIDIIRVCICNITRPSKTLKDFEDIVKEKVIATKFDRSATKNPSLVMKKPADTIKPSTTHKETQTTEKARLQEEKGVNTDSLLVDLKQGSEGHSSTNLQSYSILSKEKIGRYVGNQSHTGKVGAEAEKQKSGDQSQKVDSKINNIKQDEKDEDDEEYRFSPKKEDDEGEEEYNQSDDDYPQLSPDDKHRQSD